LGRKSNVILSDSEGSRSARCAPGDLSGLLVVKTMLRLKPPKAGKSRPQKGRPRDPSPLAQDDICFLRTGIIRLPNLDALSSDQYAFDKTISP
jgi:hypothetical protein